MTNTIIVPLSEHSEWYFVYTNLRQRPMSFEERYEANIRSDFRCRSVQVFDSVKCVHQSDLPKV